jgi:hypothetical protein
LGADQTQGGAALCPGLFCCRTFGAPEKCATGLFCCRTFGAPEKCATSKLALRVGFAIMKNNKSRPEPSSWYKSWLLKSTLLLVLVAVFLGGVIWAGRWGLEHLRDSNRYDVAFADIECEPPAGLDRQRFLDEVQYYASPKFPQRLHLLDQHLADQLREGFAKHPWVEKVDEVTIKPPKQITVKLTHRTPVLAVKFGGEVLAIDRAGVLLPKDAPTRGLPMFDGDAKKPNGIGLRWGDPNVEAAARTAKK